MSYIPMSQAREGEIVTTQTEYNGTGLGYLVDGTVYVSTGNGFAIEGSENFPKVVGFEQDGGQGYRQRALCLMVFGKPDPTPDNGSDGADDDKFTVWQSPEKAELCA